MREPKLRYEDLSGYEPAKTGDVIRIMSAREVRVEGKIGVVRYVTENGELCGTWGDYIINPATEDYFVLRRA